ncbi:MAG: SRPBCC family protein [Bacteroidales bacterium]|nr:SRPBCC family protein [Bacteroidales bacterium]
MQKVKLITRLMFVLTISCTSNYVGYAQQSNPKGKMEQQVIDKVQPTAGQFVSSPLRTRVRLELNASAPDVWALVGHPERMPEYSAGLRKVDSQHDSSGNCTAFTCHFLPMEDGGEETTHNEIVKWYEPNQGLASMAEEPNVFGLQQSLGLITLEAAGNKTIFTWDMHFNAENEVMLKMNITAFEQSLNGDIARQLIEKFGGKVLESYVEGKK